MQILLLKRSARVGDGGVKIELCLSLCIGYACEVFRVRPETQDISLSYAVYHTVLIISWLLIDMIKHVYFYVQIHIAQPKLFFFAGAHEKWGFLYCLSC